MALRCGDRAPAPTAGPYKHSAPLDRAPAPTAGPYKHSAPLDRAPAPTAGPYKHSAPLDAKKNFWLPQHELSVVQLIA